MAEPDKKITLGTVKWYDRTRPAGVIAIRDDRTKAGVETELYFELSPDDPLRLKLREGQLVQFVEEEMEGAGKVAREIQVVIDEPPSKQYKSSAS